MMPQKYVQELYAPTLLIMHSICTLCLCWYLPVRLFEKLTFIISGFKQCAVNNFAFKFKLQTLAGILHCEGQSVVGPRAKLMGKGEF